MELLNKQVFLTPREREIIALIADGHSAKGIAARMLLSPRTVERHIENCKLKLHARNTSQLVSRAIIGGYLPSGGAN
jgi:LuxR family transcriptional regulator of spore coat protein